MTVIRRKSPLGEMLSLRQAVDRLSLPRGAKNDAAVDSFDKPRQTDHAGRSERQGELTK